MKMPPSPPYNQPISGNDLARFAGLNSFMRLPVAPSSKGLDVAVVGIPMDHATSWRSGTRFGPQAVRQQSAMIRPYNIQTGAAPFDSLNIADMGDIAINTFNLAKSLRIIENWYDGELTQGTVPITIGGDHSITLGILRGLAKKHAPFALIHVDAHADVNEEMFGERDTHGTVFRRAYEEGILIPEQVYQIGLRGTGYTPEDFTEAEKWGFKMHLAQDLWHKSLAPLAKKIAGTIGTTPTYLSFDIDSLDPAFAPGTGTPEIGGLSVIQALELIRGLKGVAFIGADLVEVSPPYDLSGTTALVGANLLFEIISVLPDVKYR